MHPAPPPGGGEKAALAARIPKRVRPATCTGYVGAGSIAPEHDEQAQHHPFPPPDGVGDTACVHFHPAPGPRDALDS